MQSIADARALSTPAAVDAGTQGASGTLRSQLYADDFRQLARGAAGSAPTGRQASRVTSNSMRVFFDTSVLVYCTDNQSPAKQAVALVLVEKHSAAGQAVISTQVLVELYNVLVNKQKVPAHLAAELVNQCAVWPVVDSNLTLVQNAIARTLEQSLLIWEAMVVEAANRCGADTLLTDDMSNGVRYGVTVMANPFL